MSYAELLKSPKWQRKRLHIFQRDDWKCRKCGVDDMTLHIHHLYYNMEFLPWEYPDSALLTLCDLCHEKAHFMQWVTREGVRKLIPLGFPATDIVEVQAVVHRQLDGNNHPESARRYMSDIKGLLCDG